MSAVTLAAGKHFMHLLNRLQLNCKSNEQKQVPGWRAREVISWLAPEGEMV